MFRLIAQRLIDTIPVLLLASLAIFALLRLIPGDPAAMLAGPDASQDAVEAIRIQFGLDRSLPVQYFYWVVEALQGNLGVSFITGQPVTQMILDRLPATVELAATAYLLMVVVGVTTGIVAGLKRGKPADLSITALNTVALSIPGFWTGILLLLVFGLKLRWLPLAGRVPVTEDPLDALRHLILPAITLALAMMPELSWFVRNSVLDVLSNDHVRTARAKGLAEPQVISGHVLRNAMIPILTILGLQAGRLLGGAVVVESIFGWPGLGRLLLQSILNRDYPMVQGILLLIVVIFVTVNLVVDLLYLAADPRLR